MGTKLFAKVYRIVTKWYGNPVDETIDDAIHAWKTGYFEGRVVFSEPDPGDVKLAVPTTEDDDEMGAAAVTKPPVQTRSQPEDPNHAGIRIDLSGIGDGRPNNN